MFRGNKTKWQYDLVLTLTKWLCALTEPVHKHKLYHKASLYLWFAETYIADIYLAIGWTMMLVSTTVASCRGLKHLDDVNKCLIVWMHIKHI